MRIERASEAPPDWDEFAQTRAAASLGHASAWGLVFRDAYGIEPLYLTARDPSGTLRGVLPLARFRGLTGRVELSSLPFLDTAGVLADGPEVEDALLEDALALTRELGATTLELRQRSPLPGRPAPPTPRVDLVLALPRDEEELWRKLSAKVRNQTRKASREGLRLLEGPPERHLEGFYDPFRINMRDLGSPPHGIAFFRAAARHFGERLRFLVACDGERPVGGLVAIQFGSTVSVPWASTLRSERRRCPNNLIYWEALRWAVKQGAAELDFGRSPPGSGTYRFKRGWGAVERPLVWMRFDRQGALRPSRPTGEAAGLRRLSGLWRHLPQGLCDRVGPLVRRRLSS